MKKKFSLILLLTTVVFLFASCGFSGLDSCGLSEHNRQELQSEYETLKSENTRLKEKLAGMKEKIKTLEKEIKALDKEKI